MLKRKRNKKVTAKEKVQLLKSGNKYLTCKKCGITEIKTNHDTVAVTCGICVAEMMGMPEKPKYLEKSGRPAGWHFKNYFEHEGKVYSKGVEITEPDEIKELKLQNKSSKATKKTTTKKVSKKTTSKKKTSTRGRKRANTTR